MGKTSTESRLNLPGKLAWFLMETPGMLVVLWSVLTLPKQLGVSETLPWPNYTMAGLYCIHYTYRAILFPLLQPTMSPIHVGPFLGAIAFNVLNGISIGGWTAGYGPTTGREWGPNAIYRVQLGMVWWGWSLLANIYHDDDLREIRRAAARMQKERAEKAGKKDVEGVHKIYMIPKNGLFHFILYAHYFCEWFEWAGFWIIGGKNCQPARTFLINEISTMLPRAVEGRKWYINKFGKEKVGSKKAIIPGIL